MLLKYAARCALAEGQTLEGPVDASGNRARFPGSLGVAPEWNTGACDRACQEKVSSCLIALVNRTGKHVQVSLLSAATSMAKGLMPSDTDVGFPHQAWLARQSEFASPLSGSTVRFAGALKVPAAVRTAGGAVLVHRSTSPGWSLSAS